MGGGQAGTPNRESIVAVTATTAAITPSASSAGSSRTCFIDSEAPTIMILAVQALDRGQGLVIVDHFHEAETPAPTGLTITQDLGAAHRPVLLEQFLQLRGCDRVFKVANVKP